MLNDLHQSTIKLKWVWAIIYTAQPKCPVHRIGTKNIQNVPIIP